MPPTCVGKSAGVVFCCCPSPEWNPGLPAPPPPCGCLSAFARQHLLSSSPLWGGGIMTLMLRITPAPPHPARPSRRPPLHALGIVSGGAGLHINSQRLLGVGNSTPSFHTHSKASSSPSTHRGYMRNSCREVVRSEFERQGRSSTDG